MLDIKIRVKELADTKIADILVSMWKDSDKPNRQHCSWWKRYWQSNRYIHTEQGLRKSLQVNRFSNPCRRCRMCLGLYD